MDAKKTMTCMAEGTNNFLMSTIERHNIQPKDCLLVLRLSAPNEQKRYKKKACSKQEQAILTAM